MFRDMFNFIKKIYYVFVCSSRKHLRYYIGYSYFVKNREHQVEFGKNTVKVFPFQKLSPCGNSVHILCSGPSVNKINELGKLFSRPVIVMNGSHKIYQGTEVVFDYYVVSDIGFVKRNWELFAEGISKSNNLLFDHRVIVEALRLDSSIFNKKKIYVFDLFKRPYNKKLSKHNPTFSIDAKRGFNSSKTVAFLAMQLVVAMGYKEVVFFGMDLNSKSRFYPENTQEKSMIDADFIQIQEDFGHASEICQKKGIQVLNACPDSRLPEGIFPKVDPNELLEAYSPCE